MKCVEFFSNIYYFHFYMNFDWKRFVAVKMNINKKKLKKGWTFKIFLEKVLNNERRFYEIFKYWLKFKNSETSTSNTWEAVGLSSNPKALVG